MVQVDQLHAEQDTAVSIYRQRRTRVRPRGEGCQGGSGHCPPAALTQLGQRGLLDARAQFVADGDASDLARDVLVVGDVAEHGRGVTVISVGEGVPRVPVARSRRAVVPEPCSPQQRGSHLAEGVAPRCIVSGKAAGRLLGVVCGRTPWSPSRGRGRPGSARDCARAGARPACVPQPCRGRSGRRRALLRQPRTSTSRAALDRSAEHQTRS